MRNNQPAKSTFRPIFLFAMVIIFVLLAILVSCNPDDTRSKEPTTPVVSSTTRVIASTFTPTFQPSPTSTSTTGPLGQLTFGGNANVRSGPGTIYQVTRVVKSGDTLPVYGRSENGEWFWVDQSEPAWVFAGIATADVAITMLPLGPTMAPTFTKTPIPSPTPRPSPTLVPAITLNTIYNNFQYMTGLQFNAYKQKIAGKPVRETVTVRNVSDHGVVSLRGDWSPELINWSDFCVVLTGMPKDKALGLYGGEEFAVEATIDGIVGNYNYYINCENTLVLRYVK